jgi:hypothetical protein
MSLLSLSPEIAKKLLRSIEKYDIDARHPNTGNFFKPEEGEFPFYDPETYAQDIYNYVLHDFDTVNGFDSGFASDLLEDVLGEAENLMQQGTIDEVIESTLRGEPDSWIQQLVEQHNLYDPGSGDYDEIAGVIEETASDALTYYRDNWLGYHGDELTNLAAKKMIRVGDEIDMKTALPQPGQSMGVLSSDGITPAAQQSSTGVLSDPLGYPKIPGGMDAARQVPPQEQAFEDLLQKLGLLHQY